MFTPETLEVAGRADAKTLAPLDLRGAGLCRAAEALGALCRAAHRRRRRRGGGGALARCGVRARAVGRRRAQGGGGPQDCRRRHRRDPLRAERRLPVDPPFRHPCEARGRRKRAVARIPSSRRRPSPLRSISPSTAPLSLTLAPVARETRVSLASDWPHPSFSGAFLPDERQVTPQASRPPGKFRTWRAACPRPGASRRRAWSGCSPMRSA